MAKHISYRAAVEALRTIFGDDGQDIFTLDEIFQRTGRNPSQQEQNKKWITNRLTDLKHYNLVKPLYTNSSPRVLEKVQLSPEGKHALKTAPSQEFTQEITLESIARDIKEFQKQNPSIVIEFAAKVKEIVA